MSEYDPTEHPEETQAAISPRQGKILFGVFVVFLTCLYLFFASSTSKPETPPPPYNPPEVSGSSSTITPKPLPTAPSGSSTMVPPRATATSLKYATESASPGMGFGGKPVPANVAKILKDRQTYNDSTAASSVAYLVVQIMAKRDWHVTPGYVIRRLEPLVDPLILNSLADEVFGWDWSGCVEDKCLLFPDTGLEKTVTQPDGYTYTLRADIYNQNGKQGTQYWKVVVKQNYQDEWMATEVTRIS